MKNPSDPHPLPPISLPSVLYYFFPYCNRRRGQKLGNSPVWRIIFRSSFWKTPSALTRFLHRPRTLFLLASSVTPPGSAHFFPYLRAPDPPSIRATHSYRVIALAKGSRAVLEGFSWTDFFPNRFSRWADSSRNEHGGPKQIPSSCQLSSFTASM